MTSVPQKSFRCLAYCTAANVRMADLIAFFGGQAIDHKFYKSSNVLQRQYGVSNGLVFYFGYGVVVCWDLTKDEEDQILRELAGFEVEKLEIPEIEESTYSVGQAVKIVRDEITLPAEDALTKLSISHGLAQSVKLGVFEKLILRVLDITRYIPEGLAQTGRIALSGKQIRKMMGKLFLERRSVNLHTDILDTPEFFWEYSELEPLYRFVVQDLDMAARIQVLNKRLDVVHELFEMLNDQLSHRHSTILESVIVGLILIEILMAVMKDILGWI